MVINKEPSDLKKKKTKNMDVIQDIRSGRLQYT